MDISLSGEIFAKNIFRIQCCSTLFFIYDEDVLYLVLIMQYLVNTLELF